MGLISLPILIGFGLLALLFEGDSDDGSNTAVGLDDAPEPVDDGDTVDILDTVSAVSTDPAESDIIEEDDQTQPVSDADDNLIELDEQSTTFFGSGSSETIVGTGDANAIFGGANHDDLIGRGGNDSLFGEEGLDILSGNVGDDVLRGGVWHDALNGGSGSDTLFGDEGGDSLFGSSGADDLYGGDGRDLLVGEGGNDSIEGGDGTDTLIGGSWDLSGVISGDLENAFGNAVRAAIDAGSTSQNPLNTSMDYTVLTQSGDGADTLEGGQGNDVLFVGNFDHAEGDGGADSFVVLAGGEGSARIDDFESGTDKLLVQFDPDATGGEIPTVDVISRGPDAYVEVDGDVVARLVGSAGQLETGDVLLFRL